MKSHEKIIVLDFGGQYAHLIASRIRRSQVLSEIYNPDEIDLEYLRQENVKGIILSGGPQSVYEEGSPRVDNEIFDLGKPILGICYGHHYMNHALGGTVTPGDDDSREYGRATLKITECPLFKNIPTESTFWMSHGDHVTALPEGFSVAGSTSNCGNAAVFSLQKNFYGIQFHPEVTHSEYGSILLQNFIDICGAKGDWTIEHWLEEKSEELKGQIGDKQVILFVSGGVDSTVSFAFLSKVLGPERIKGLFFDTGLLREGEVDYVMRSIRAIGADLTLMSEADRFIGNLEGVYDPEKKREIIGNTFLSVQREYFATHKLEDNAILAQGTIYPDTIETGGTKNSSTIKTHHNRVPEIQKMIDEGKVIEPIADLYKDEVRALGEALGLPHELVWRHPFPGPGLGVRILCSEEEITRHQLPITSYDTIVRPYKSGEYSVLPIKSVGVQGDFRTYRHPAIIFQERNIKELEQTATIMINQNAEINRCLYPLGYKGDCHDIPDYCSLKSCFITPERIARLQRADHIVTEALHEANLYEKVWQFPVVLVPLSFDGKGSESIILRPIDSTDVMSASVSHLPWDFFEHVTTEILKDKTISAVFLDVTSKPPGTVEWE